MKYKCISKDLDVTWLSIGEIYDAETAVSPKEYSGGQWLEIRKADDNYPCYARKLHFSRVIHREDNTDLTV